MAAEYPIALQLYSVREAAQEDLRGVLERVAAMGYLGVEPAGLFGMAPEEFKKTVDGLGLQVTSSGLRARDEAKLAGSIELATSIGAAHCTGGLSRRETAAVIADLLRVPVLLYATKEPPARRDASRADMTGRAEPGEDTPIGGLHQFQLRPGPVTLCRLAECRGEWRMLIVGGRICPSDEVLAGTWSWVEVQDHDRLYRTLVEQGFIHHASPIHGDYADAFRLACRFLDIRPVEVA